MTNPRDTGRWDAFGQQYVNQQVRVDFAWGNMPMQPNDDRGMAQLDPALDSHIIATAGYEGFPAFIQGPPYDDTLPNAVVPDLSGLTAAEANAAITALDLVPNELDASTEGATSENNGLVAVQAPVANTVVNTGTSVSFGVYEYQVPGVTFSVPTDMGTNSYLYYGTFFPQSPSVALKAAAQAAVAGDQVIVGGTTYTLANKAGTSSPYETMSTTFYLFGDFPSQTATQVTSITFL